MVFYRTTIVIVLIALFLSTEAKTYARLSCYTPINSYNDQLAKADSFKSYLDFELADQIYLDLLKRSDQEDILCYASLSRADNYLRHKKTKEAIDIIDNVELNTLYNSSSSVLDITYLQAQILYQLGQYDSALVLYKTVDQFFKRNNYDPLYRGEFLNNFGELYLYGFEDIPRAKKCIDEALNIWQNQSDDSHFILGRIYYNLANIYGRRTEAAIQVNYVEKAMSIAKLYNKKYPRLQFVCYSLFAESSAINQKPKEAIEWIKKQIIYAEKNKINTDLLMYSYNDLAEYYFRDENFLSSLKYNNYIINNFESSALQSSLVYSISLRRQATCFYIIGDFIESEKYYKKSIHQFDRKNERRYAQTLRYYVDFLIIQNRFEEAKIYNDSVITIYTRNWEIDQNESYLYGLILGWSQKGELILAQSENYESALNAYLKAAYYMDCHRDIYYYDETEINIGAGIKPIYENIIYASDKLYKSTKDSKYLENIFYAIESNKYQALWKKIKDRELYTHEDMPDSLSIVVNKLLKEIREVNIDYIKSEERNSDEFIKLNTLKSQLAKLTNDDFSYKFTSSRINLSAIADVITSKEVVIELFEGDSTCHGLLISRDTTIYFSFQLNEIYLSALSTYQHIIRGDELLLPLDLQLKNYINCTQSISEPFVELLLNNEIFNDVKSLTIIPDGVFTFLPFEALITANDRSIIDFKSVPYFLKKWDITYHISGKMLLESRSSIPSNHKVNIKAVGPSEDAILFSAIEEIKHIKRRFGNKCLAVLDNQRNVILNDQSNDKILHLASHAVIDTNNYNLSFLHFGDEKNDSLKIYDYEISNHKFQNALVVLNACETFQGKVYKGEGVYNLSQSFLIGGASSVISTLWKIEDQSAAKLMTLFYENIKKGEAYEASLNLAKRSMLNEQVHAHPFFWASYLFNGESQTNFKKEKTVNRLVLLLAVSISLISLMYVINRKSKQA